MSGIEGGSSLRPDLHSPEMPRIAVAILVVVICGPTGSISLPSAQTASATIEWQDALKQKADWYGSNEAIRIADSVVLYQRDSGGWPKNIDMASVLSESERANLIKERHADDSTIDNGAAYTQLIYL